MTSMEIRAELQDLSTIKKRLRVEIPAEVAQREYNHVAGEYRRQARLPGFRPGKAPVELVKRHFRKNIRDDVLQKLIPESYDQAIREKGVEPVSRPNVGQLDYEEGTSLVYAADFEIAPVIDLPEYKGLPVESQSTEVTEEDVQKELDRIRQENARLEAVEGRPVQEGDYAVVNLDGYPIEAESEGQGADAKSQAAPSTIHEEDLVIQVGEEHTHKSFTGALLGMNVGETKEFEADYPDNYPEKKLAGRRVAFTLSLTDLKCRVLPELNDDFAKDLGQVETLEQLKEQIREQLKTLRERNREADLKNKLVEQLLERTQFEVPEALREDRIDEMIRDLAYRLASRGVDPTKANVNWAKAREDFQPQAEQFVRAQLILSEIAQRERLEVSSEDIDQELRRVAQSTGQPVEKVRQYFLKENRTAALGTQLLREKALDLLLRSAKVD